MQPRQYASHGDGRFSREDFLSIGENVIFEPGVLVFHPENIRLGSNIYIGHYTILKGYYKNEMIIQDNSWVGQQCFLHGAGGLKIGRNVGIGPGVKILTSYHTEEGQEVPILFSRTELAEVIIADDCDLGIGCIILPGVRIGRGSQIGAGSVVNRSIEAFSIAAGVPARAIMKRPTRQNR